MTALDRWQAFAKKLLVECDKVFVALKVRTAKHGEMDVNLNVLALLARTVSSLRGVQLMIEHKLITEARTLARCIYENMFYAEALAKDGDRFLERMEDESKRHVMIQSKEYLKWSQQQETDYDFTAKLRESTAYFEKEGMRFEKTTWKQAAQAAGAEDAYLTYSSLSYDAAHASIESLHRHLGSDEYGGVWLFRAAQTDDVEMARTLGIACTGLLAVYRASCQINDHRPAIKILPELTADMKAIQDLTEVPPG